MTDTPPPHEPEHRPHTAAPAPPPPAPAPAAQAPAVVWESPERTEGPAPGIEYAPHGGRLVAYILDSIILTIVAGFFIVIGVVLLASGATIDGDRVTAIEPGRSRRRSSCSSSSGTIIAMLYFPFFWARGGQTPGMRPFGLRVVRDRDGSRIGWGTALLRLVGLWVAGGRLLHRLHLDLRRQATARLAGPHRRDRRHQAALSGWTARGSETMSEPTPPGRHPNRRPAQGRDWRSRARDRGSSPTSSTSSSSSWSSLVLGVLAVVLGAIFSLLGDHPGARDHRRVGRLLPVFLVARTGRRPG